MRIINGIVFAMVAVLFLLWVKIGKKEEKKCKSLEIYLKKHIHIVLLILAVNTVSFFMTFQNNGSSTYIEKDGFGGEEKQVGFLLEAGDRKEELTLNVRPRKLTKKEEKKKMEEAFSYLSEHLKGENLSLKEVKENLDFSLDFERYPFDVEFQPEDYSLIDGEGVVRNHEEELLEGGFGKEEMKKGILTSVTVSLWYEEECQKKTYEVTILPRAEEKETYFSKIEDAFQKKEAEALYKEGFTLPLLIDGVKIIRLDNRGISPIAVLLLGVIFAGLMMLREQEEKKQAEIKKRELLLRSYPWFVNELVLLLGAGMQVKNIFGTLITEYKNSEGLSDYRDPLMKEIEAAKNSMELGMSEEEVYYRLGRRLKLPCYIKLMTILEQNVKKGARGLTETFEQEELAALEERKNLAKRYGEEAGTKLLGPMILLLLVVMFMIILPAFLSFGM